MEAKHTVSSIITRLPIEIILLIVESLVPQNDATRPILPALHPITKTLLSLTRVSKAIYPTACKLIWQNCLYLDTKSKLRKFRRYISKKSPITGRLPCDAYGSARLYLNPLRYKFDTASTYDTISPSTCRASRRSGRYPMQDLRTIYILEDVLITLAPVLKTLIVDMPLRDIDPWEDVIILKSLRQGFEALVNVEELISVKDELYLGESAIGQYQVFTKWPKLRRLCLYNVMMEEQLWKDMASCPQLESAVFIRPDPSDDDLSNDDIKGEWARAWATANPRDTKRDGLVYEGPKMAIAFCNWPPYLPDFNSMIPHWQEVDPDNKISVLNVATHARYDRKARKRGPIASCQDWVRDHSLLGTIWSEVERKGQPVTPPIVFEEGQVEEDDDEWVDDDDGADWTDDDDDSW
ncbi:hypothetical protein FOC1_g10012374 [Fusarium oxysporum f. sp. cubense race 1]|uniref:Uncharacterized protein n=1 Tax=Fusarium oxysporum f. sp. cubense (strain race 1) TaxID=1229664 RepID=N4UNQ7_FUSC1|nr:hypothetical protein FOC1_g10012374 [Fusarium oxysporum f. sp. cubense race 1]